jgi:hypothetical protein
VTRNEEGREQNPSSVIRLPTVSERKCKLDPVPLKEREECWRKPKRSRNEKQEEYNSCFEHSKIHKKQGSFLKA